MEEIKDLHNRGGEQDLNSSPIKKKSYSSRAYYPDPPDSINFYFSRLSNTNFTTSATGFRTIDSTINFYAYSSQIVDNGNIDCTAGLTEIYLCPSITEDNDYYIALFGIHRTANNDEIFSKLKKMNEYSRFFISAANIDSSEEQEIYFYEPKHLVEISIGSDWMTDPINYSILISFTNDEDINNYKNFANNLVQSEGTNYNIKIGLNSEIFGFLDLIYDYTAKADTAGIDGNSDTLFFEKFRDTIQFPEENNVAGFQIKVHDPYTYYPELNEKSTGLVPIFSNFDPVVVDNLDSFEKGIGISSDINYTKTEIELKKIFPYEINNKHYLSCILCLSDSDVSFISEQPIAVTPSIPNMKVIDLVNSFEFSSFVILPVADFDDSIRKKMIILSIRYLDNPNDIIFITGSIYEYSNYAILIGDGSLLRPASILYIIPTNISNVDTEYNINNFFLSGDKLKFDDMVTSLSEPNKYIVASIIG